MGICPRASQLSCCSSGSLFSLLFSPKLDDYLLLADLALALRFR